MHRGPSTKWLFTREQLENTPSRRCGIEADRELSYRQQAANLIQDIGQRLNVYPFSNVKASYGTWPTDRLGLVSISLQKGRDGSTSYRSHLNSQNIVIMLCFYLKINL